MNAAQSKDIAVMPLLRITEVARLLACSIATVYALIDRRELPAVRIGAGGGGVRVKLQDLEHFIESRRTVTHPKDIKQVRLKHLH
jgi:excisionase family DNA binding protein